MAQLRLCCSLTDAAFSRKDLMDCSRENSGTNELEVPTILSGLCKGEISGDMS